MRDRTQSIQISDKDLAAITRVLDNLSLQQRGELQELEEEMARAEIVVAKQMPRDIVTLYSTVVYEDLDNGKVMMAKLTLPNDANVDDGRISILAPVGAALLGLKVGQDIAWPLPNGRVGRVRVKQLIQPMETDPWAPDGNRDGH